MKSQESNVACRQLGYEDGAAHFQRGNASRLGDLRRLAASNQEVLRVARVDCRGDEADLDGCSWRLAGRKGDDEERRRHCDLRQNAVALVCERPSPALCPDGMEPFRCEDHNVAAAAFSFFKNK